MISKKAKSNIFLYNFLPESRKGSHVGFIMSFLIFVTFVVFLFSILQPTIQKERTKNYVLDNLKLTLLENASSEVTSVSISIEESTGNKFCARLNSVDEEAIPEEYRENLIIKNSSEDVLNYTLSGGENVIEIETGQYFTGTLTAYYSNTFSESETSVSGGCTPYSPNDEYVVGTIKTYSESTESDFLELNETYYEDYENLKVSLGVPEGTEFSFSLLNSTRDEIFTSEIESPPESINIYVSEVPTKYISEGGETEFGFLRIKVW